MKNTHIVVLVKQPQAAKVKTRLIPELGEQKAALLADAMIKHTLKTLLVVLEQNEQIQVNFCVAPDSKSEYWQQFKVHERIDISQQCSGDLGKRMATVARELMLDGSKLILIGSDCPAISADVLLKVHALLQSSDAVIHPASDGGYVLLGLSRYCEAVFTDIPWSTEQVAPRTLAALEQAAFKVKILETMNDIDEAEDLIHLPVHLQTLLDREIG